MDKKFSRLKHACYMVNISGSVVGNLSPLLFVTFRSLYGISYSLLGLLVVINFGTQLLIDLAFSFFSYKFNIPLAVKLTPVLTAIGIFVYAVFPFFFPGSVYLGLIIGTVIFSSAGGLAEVLISPVIAAIPSEYPDSEMSRLHSVYAWGVVFVVIFITLFLLLFGQKNWQYLALSFLIIPVIASVLFSGSKIPEMKTPEKVSGAFNLIKDKNMILCFFCIFLGGASECTMSQWSSSYIEQALGIQKIWGDVFGVAMFGAALGFGRSLYAKIGKNINRALFFGAVGATVCYLVAVFVNVPFVGLIACAVTGFCVSMLWPGSLIVASGRMPYGGVAVFALMAAGGDMGAAICPQLVGLVTDAVIAHPQTVSVAEALSLSAEQLGMKAGMLSATLFPLAAIILYAVIWRTDKNKRA